ncbi:hypothetical protein F2Q69_00061676 [Brassica cretica]|uniref:Uncharacterized protein n=1 Tax=Brassica cretica TaxID=69181 RepID=A0A8S9RQZ5_BRACR|nr:hypothetical protein F2Q69_00061676 [Brassica cretica]
MDLLGTYEVYLNHIRSGGLASSFWFKVELSGVVVVSLPWCRVVRSPLSSGLVGLQICFRRRVHGGEGCCVVVVLK